MPVSDTGISHGERRRAPAQGGRARGAGSYVLGRLENDHRDPPRGLLLVAGIPWVDPDHLRPEPLALLALGIPCADAPPLLSDLHLCLLALEIVVPGGVVRSTANGCDQDEVSAVAPVHQRSGALLSRLPALDREQQDRRRLYFASELASGRAVKRGVDRACELQEQLAHRSASLRSAC